jgi:asparagine synthase (glutamine-hydrolysing)
MMVGGRFGRRISGSFSLASSGYQRSPRVGAVLLVGTLRNLPSLASELAVGEEDPERVLALAFDRWGERMLGRLRGGFVIILWDPAAKRGFLAVDQLGIGSLFFHESPGRLSFATEIRDLFGLLDRRPAPDPGAVVKWLADGYLERGQTHFEGVCRLEGGSLVRLEGDEWWKTRYWSPRYAPPGRPSTEEVAGELGATLSRAVRERVAVQGTAAVLLSGGLDSSSVAAIASRLDPPVAGLRAYSLVFPDHPEADESALIGQLTSWLGIPGQVTTIRGGSVLRASLEYQRAWELPETSPTSGFNLPMLRRAAEDGVRVLLSGEGGDELFGCSPYLLADRLLRGDLRGAITLSRRLPGVGDKPTRNHVWALVREYGLKGAAPRSLHRAVRSVRPASRCGPGWLAPSAARLYVRARDDWAWKSVSGPRWWAYQSERLTSWRERMGVHDFLRRRDQLAGVETRHPFLDDVDLIELMLRLPPELAFDANLSRPVLRRSVRQLLPEAIVLRREKSHFTPLFVHSLNGPDRAFLTELLTARDAEILAYARPEGVRALFKAWTNRLDFGSTWQLWRLATIECWLRAQSDTSFPERALETQRRLVGDYDVFVGSGGRARTS